MLMRTLRDHRRSRTSSPPPGRGWVGAAAGALSPGLLWIKGVPIPSASAPATTASTGAPPSTSAVTTKSPTASVATTPGISAPTINTKIDLQPYPNELIRGFDNVLLPRLNDPSHAKLYGIDIKTDLATHLQHIATAGLPKDTRKELTDKYSPPANCTLIEAPILNQEVVAAIPEAVLKRDKDIEQRQKQRTSAISCIAEAIILQMTLKPKNISLIRKLMDAIKLTCDRQYIDSTIRRSFILNTVKKDLKMRLQATKIGRLLFSENLAENLKAAKATSKSGADMKPAAAKQASVKTKPPQKSSNRRSPLQNLKPRRSPRKKQPIHKDRLASTSKPSSRPAQRRNRNGR